MKISLNVPEVLLQQLVDEAGDRPASLEVIAVNHLKAGLPIVLGQRYLVIQGDSLRRLEQILDVAQLISPEDLVIRTDRLAKVTFGRHEIKLTQAQLEELTWRAKKAGKTVAQMVEGAWRVLQEQFFTAAIGVK